MELEKQEHYAVRRLRESLDRIRLDSREMPELRKKVERYLKQNRKKARSCRDDLLSRKERLLESLESCRLCLMELEEYDLAKFAYQIQAALRPFPVMAPDYSKFSSALSAFLDKLKEGKTSAAVIDRLMANVKMGFYPTDPGHIEQLKQGIAFPDCQVNLFDPCCGCGEALHTLGHGENCKTYGTEIDTARAEQAQEVLDRVGFGNYFQSRISRDCFHLMLLNPPYLSVYTENGSTARHEKRFLAESFDRLAEGGVLIYIIPYYRLTGDIARILCDHFSDLSVYRFSGKEFERFRQIAVLGVRQKRRSGEELVQRLMQCTLTPETIPELRELPSGRYSLPGKELEVPIFKGAQFNVGELQAELARNKPFAGLLRDTETKQERRPLLPLKVDQIGLIGAAGEMNGYIGGEFPHVLKGRVVKSTYHDTETTKRDEYGRPLCVEDTYTVTNKLIFTILTQQGCRELSA